MKRIPLTLAVVAILSCPLTALEAATFHSPQAKFKIIYPDAWTAKEGEAGSVVTLQAGSKADGYAESVNAMVQSLAGKGMDLDAYTRFSMDQLKQMVMDLQVEREGNRFLGGYPGKEIQYSGKSKEGERSRFYQAWTVKGDQVYLLTFSAREGEFDRLFPEAKKTIDSFEFI